MVDPCTEPYRNPSVVVVGAGIAGLSAAARLSQKCKVVVLEAQNQIGGRISSFQSGNRTYDLGASWFHDIDNNQLYSDIQESILSSNHKPWPLEIDHTDENYEMNVIADDGSVSTVQDVSEKLKCAENILETIGDDASEFDMSLEEYAHTYLQPDVGIALRAYESYVGLLWSQMSAVETPPTLLDHGTDAFQFGGNELVIDFLKSKLNSANTELILNAPVTSISNSEPGITVSSAAGQFFCKHVIVTAPLAVLQKAKPSLFASPIPEPLENAITNATIAVLAKVVLEFPKRFWRKGLGRVCCIYKNTSVMFSCIYDTQNENEHSVNKTLLAFVPGPLGASIERDHASAWPELKQFIKPLVDSEVGIVDPQQVHVSSWSKNEYIRGAYSSLSKGQNMRDLVLPMMQGAWDDKLLFAGEHCTIQGIGCMDGAYVSGISAAEKVLND